MTTLGRRPLVRKVVSIFKDPSASPALWVVPLSALKLTIKGFSITRCRES